MVHDGLNAIVIRNRSERLFDGHHPEFDKAFSPILWSARVGIRSDEANGNAEKDETPLENVINIKISY